MSANAVRFWKIAQLTVTGCGIVAMMACAKSDSGETSTSASTATISGTLSLQSASGLTDAVSKFQESFAVADTSISLDCGTAGIFTATVNASTGAFSASGVPTGVPCSFNFVSSSSNTIKCQVQFQDSSSYDLNNNPMTTSTATASSSISLGSISCDTSGNITVNSGSVAGVNSSATVSTNTAFDFTGVWTAAVYDGALPTGYQTITNCTSNCNGPSVGMNISLVRFHGQEFTPSSGQCTPATNVTCHVSDGTVDTTKDGYGMSIWGGDYAHGIGACGGNTGFTADEARAFAHLSLDTTAPSLSGNQLSYAHYAWSTQTGFGGDAGWTQPWMYTGATSQYDIMDCQPVSVPSTTGGVASKPGFACFSRVQSGGGPTSTYIWSVGLANSGGCVDSNNKPVMVSNWANITGSCSNSASSFNTNLNTNTCTYTNVAAVSGGANTSFTCSFTGGAFKDISGSTGSSNNNGPDFTSAYTFSAGQWPGQPATFLSQGQTCKGGTAESTLKTAAGGAASSAQAVAAKELLIRYQCYANAYWQHSSHGNGSTSCSRDYDFNWSTNSYANFVIGDDRSMKPQNAFITDRVFYSPDGQWGFLKNTQVRYQTVPTANGSQLCPMKSMVEIKFHHVTDSKLLVDFGQITQMADTSPACQGAVVAAIAGGGNLSSDPQGLNNLYQQLQPQRVLFYITK